MSFSLIRRPAAFLPIVMSLAALALVLVHAAIYGVVHEADEGTAAHIFQLLMAAQAPVIAWFAVTGLTRAPGPTVCILALQGGAAMAAFAAVYCFT